MATPERTIRIVPGVRHYHISRHEDEVSDFSLDWTRLLSSSENISTVTASASNVGIDSSSNTNKVSTHYLSGGDSGVEGYIDVKITTNAATARTFKVRVWVKTQNYTGFRKSTIW